MAQETVPPEPASANQARTFLLVVIPGALVAWDMGFELGAFETFSYKRAFAVFVVSVAVVAATFIADDDTYATSYWSRAILSLPALFLIADFLVEDPSGDLALLFTLTLLAVFPYALWVVAHLIHIEFFALTTRNRAIACVMITVVGLLGLYVGARNYRFLFCSDFERIGDYQPSNCDPGS
ncbi:MAG: hypothetical protein R2754_06885 [Microthrixaceae bacterium]